MTTPINQETSIVHLNIEGMTCAACAGRVERALSRLDGAVATVNYATERATVTGIERARIADATEAVAKAGYRAHLRTEADDDWTRRSTLARLTSLRRRLAVSALLTVPLMDLSITLALVPNLRFPFWELVCILLAVPIVTWAAWPFHRATVRNLRHGSTSMDTLVTLGIVVSFGWAVATIMFGPDGGGYWVGFGPTPPGADSIYLDVAAGLTTFQLAGRYFETRSRRKAGEVVDALGALVPMTVRRIRGTDEELVSAADLRVGDTFAVHPGESIAADGVIREGRAAVDESVLTGEPLPREAVVGDTVMGGAVSADGYLLIEAKAVGEHTRLAQMSALAERAQESKARIQPLVDRVVTWFVPSTIGLAVLVTLVWIVAGATVTQAVGIGIAVLIIACPCALGLATPTALLMGVGRGAHMGILIKGISALEASGRVDTVVLDKTGTVTTGRMQVTEFQTKRAVDREDVLRWAGALESRSEHPAARAICEFVLSRVSQLPRVDDEQIRPGLGVAGHIEGATTVIGSPRLAEEFGVAFTEDDRRTIAVIRERGDTAIVLGRADRIVAFLALGDELKDSAVAAIASLRDLGLRTILLSGDHETTVRRVAAAVGIDDVRAGVMPESKAEVINALKRAGRHVAMVGDGINDAPALATAHLGLAVADGSDIAIRSADIVLIREDLRVVADAVRLARRTLGTIRTNLFWAFGYNMAAIPLAAAGLLNPLIAAAAMALSSVLVVANSMRLRNFVSISE